MSRQKPFLAPFDWAHITVPFNGLVIGGQGSGKTCLLREAAQKTRSWFSRIVLMTGSKRSEDMLSPHVDVVHDQGASLQALKEMLRERKDPRTLLLLDDCRFNSRVIEVLCMLSRESNVSLLVSTQLFNMFPTFDLVFVGRMNVQCEHVWGTFFRDIVPSERRFLSVLKHVTKDFGMLVVWRAKLPGVFCHKAEDLPDDTRGVEDVRRVIVDLKYDLWRLETLLSSLSQ